MLASAQAAEAGAQRIGRATRPARTVSTSAALAATTTTAIAIAAAVAATASQGVNAGAQRVRLSAGGSVVARLADAHAAQVGVGAWLTLVAFTVVKPGWAAIGAGAGVVAWALLRLTAALSAATVATAPVVLTPRGASLPILADRA